MRTALTIALIFVAMQGAGQVSFTASVNKTTISQQSTLQLSFTLKNGEPESFQPPKLDHFHVLTGPNSSSSVNIVNGNMTRAITYSYQLQPKRMGKITIGAGSMKVKGKVYESKPISINVVKGSANSQKKSDDPYGDLNLDDNLFLKIQVDRTNVYQGEQILVTYKVYTRLNIVNYDLRKLPANNSFWSYDLDNSNQIQLSNEELNGLQYRVGTIKKVALFPQRDGKLKLEPMEMKVTLRVKDKRRRRSLFDDFFGDPFGYKDIERVLVSNGVTINVKPLPSENRPTNFSGMVGQFDMKVELDKEETKADDPITVMTKISGKGNIKLLEKLELTIPPNFEVYDPKVNERVSKANNVISGYKNFDYLVIPRVAGTYKLPPVKFSYFDPVNERYVTHESEQFSIQVNKSSGKSASPVISGINKEDVSLIGEDILFIRTDAMLRPATGGLFASPLLILFLGLPFVILTAAGVWLHRQQKLMGNLVLRRVRRANSMARKRLATAKKHLGASDKGSFYDEVTRAIWGYLADKLNVQGADLTKDRVAQILTERDVPVETISQLTATLDRCEQALFSPIESGQMDNDYHETVTLISNLEEQIK